MSSPSSAGAPLSYTTPQRSMSRNLLDNYYNIAFNGTLTPKLQRPAESFNSASHINETKNIDKQELEISESESSSSPSMNQTTSSTDSLRLPKIKKEIGSRREEFSNLLNIPLIDEEFIQRHLNNLELILQKVDEYQDCQYQVGMDLENLVSRYENKDEVKATTTNHYDLLRNGSTSSFDSIQSDIDIELDYQLTSFIKSNSSNYELVKKISKVRNVVTNGLNFINDKSIKGKDLHRLDHKFVNELNELVQAYTN